MKLITSYRVTVLLLITVSCPACKRSGIPAGVLYACRTPLIEPDYSGVTIPSNIAPMNFAVLEKDRTFRIRIKSTASGNMFLRSAGNVVSFPGKFWKEMLSENQGGKIEIEVYSRDSKGRIIKFDPIVMHISKEPADPYLCYRLLFPGYESWGEMKIVQRSVSGFSESSVVENQLLKDNCVNCHTFLNNDPGRFLLHVRGSLAGTYMVNDTEISRIQLNTEQMPGNAVYPSWHPSGKYLVFSSNRIVQSVHMGGCEENTEIYDFASMLVLYDPDKKEISPLEEQDSIKYMETFPCWSPAGDRLYYCRTRQVSEFFDFREVRYDLVRRSFDIPTGRFGKTEVVYNASENGKSVSLPSISPDGRFLIFTLHDYGSFPVWHKEADLYLLDLESGKAQRMELNSDETESYHSWSSNGKWLVFSSKREDGLTSRPYFAYFGSPENIGKPFVLPQKDPGLYKKMVKTFNRPEFLTGKIKAGPRDFARASGKQPVKAAWKLR
jgi:hypothetical protein